MTSPDAKPRVLFITMPWATPVHPSLAMGLLSALLNQAGIANASLYGNLLSPRPAKPTVYGIVDTELYDDRSAGMSYVPFLYPQVTAEQVAGTIAERHLRILSRDGQIYIPPSAMDWKREGTLRRALMAQTLEDTEAARVCLSRCMDVVAAGDFDIIGFTLLFETQLVASLALAKQIKERWPERRILFGGAACASVQGHSTLKSFPFLDAVCYGEGEKVIVPLVRALRGEGELADIPGIAYRAEGKVCINKPVELLKDLDQIPVPNFDPYIEQKARSEWADTRSALTFEASRGCWWGQKHLCSFCGLNAEALVYRSKSPTRVLEQIREYADRWNIAGGLHAVDNILDTRYFKELVPQLIELRKQLPDLWFFYEIKSNLKLWQLFQLSMAGFRALQPGIESFSDHILTLMDKGATAFQQILFIKWAHQVGIGPAYNILMRNPGETVEDYREMTALIPFISHLHPPNGIANVQLERFSPYFLRPADYGIRNVRPKPLYREMFPDERVELEPLVYQFDFDHDDLDAPELVASRREFAEEVGKWQASFRPHRLVYFLGDKEVLILDSRGGTEVRRRLTGLAAALFLYLDQDRPFTRIVGQFADHTEGELRAVLGELAAQRFVYHDRRKDAYLAVVVRVYRSMEEFLAHARTEMERAQITRESIRSQRPGPPVAPDGRKRLPLSPQ